MERSFNKGSTRWKKCEIPAYLRDCITHRLILDMGHHNRIRILPFRPVSLWREDSLLSGVKGLDHPSSWTARQKRIDEADSWHGWLTWWLCVHLQYLAVGEGRRVDPFCPALSVWIKLGSCLCIEEYKNIWCTIGHSGAAKVERVGHSPSLYRVRPRWPFLPTAFFKVSCFWRSVIPSPSASDSNYCHWLPSGHYVTKGLSSAFPVRGYQGFCFRRSPLSFLQDLSMMICSLYFVCDQEIWCHICTAKYC